MEPTKQLIKDYINKQKEMMKHDLGLNEKCSVNYCILVLEDLLNQLNRSYEGTDGKLHEKNW